MFYICFYDNLHKNKYSKTGYCVGCAMCDLMILFSVNYYLQTNFLWQCFVIVKMYDDVCVHIYIC